MHWIETLEKYYDKIAPDLQPEVRAFLDEYYEKKNTHSATTLDGLTQEELGQLLYLEIKEKTTFFLEKLVFCQNLKILRIVAPITNLKFLNRFKKLRILDLYSPEISEANGDFVNLSNLLAFSFVQNKVSIDLTKEISYLGKLIIIYFENNPEKSSPSYLTAFPSNLYNLVYASLVNQGIQNLTYIADSSRLVYLRLTNNQIKVLPKSIFKISSIEDFHFDGNELETLPNAIFSMPNLNYILFSNNPYSDVPYIKTISDLMVNASVDADSETAFFHLIKKLNKPTTQADYNYVTLKIPKSLQTPMLQYFEFFKDYVATTKDKDIIFDIKRDKEGLILVTNGNTEVILPELSSYFEEYVALTQQNSEDWIFNFEQPVTAIQADILRLKMENEIGRLKNAFQIAKLESQHLSTQLSDKNAENQFLKALSQSLSSKIDVLISGRTSETLNVDQLLLDIQSVAVRMLERKPSQQLEDLHNDILTDFLRQRGYVADHTRSGRSKLRVGEIDIMIRKKDGTPFSIIEAFRLKSCGKDNKTVAEHLDKLIHDYDTAGHKRNFVIVYAEAVKFDQLWKNYKTYVSELNGKPPFRAKYPLIKFEEKSEVSEKSSIKIGLATHRREGSVIEIYHVFINMFA